MLNTRTLTLRVLNKLREESSAVQLTIIAWLSLIFNVAFWSHPLRVALSVELIHGRCRVHARYDAGQASGVWFRQGKVAQGSAADEMDDIARAGSAARTWLTSARRTTASSGNAGGCSPIVGRATRRVDGPTSCAIFVRRTKLREVMMGDTLQVLQ
jgi:hypothetical protein